MTNIASKPI